VTTAPVEIERPEVDEATEPVVDAETPWTTVVWNDPINLMSYVAYVFESYFGYPKSKARKLMLDVHQRGKAAVSKGTRE
jgi:ATP-dependent Clp protease adaptor protein ClpS